MAETPETIQKHESDYKEKAWEQYSFAEFGMWVHVLTKRSTHRDNPEKRKKDLYDARNYLSMMDSKLKELEEA